jgi:hypothetical protein
MRKTTVKRMPVLELKRAIDQQAAPRRKTAP